MVAARPVDMGYFVPARKGCSVRSRGCMSRSLAARPGRHSYCTVFVVSRCLLTGTEDRAGGRGNYSEVCAEYVHQLLIEKDELTLIALDFGC